MTWFWDLVGWITCGQKIGEFREIPVHKIRLWMPGYSAAFGTRIGIAAKHLHRDPNSTDETVRMVSSRLLEHEWKHIDDQRKFGWKFLPLYALYWLQNLFFVPATMFRPKASYEHVDWEIRATQHARAIYPTSNSIKWARFHIKNK